MHNRRFGALLLGAWLAGSVIVWFAISQSALNVNRTLENTPMSLQRTMEMLGPDVGVLLRRQALLLNRRVVETWEATQLCLAGTLLVLSLFTGHRSRIMMGVSSALVVVAAVQILWLTPEIHRLGELLDFVPPEGRASDRAQQAMLEWWHRAVAMIGSVLTATAAVRLLFDFRDFRPAPRRRLQ